MQRVNIVYFYFVCLTEWHVFMSLSLRSWTCDPEIKDKNKTLSLTGKNKVNKWLPSGVFGDRHSYSQPRGGHSLADWFHVNNWVNTVRSPHNATLRIRTEAAVVQALVAMIPATLLQRDSGGHTWDSNMNYQLEKKKKTIKTQVSSTKILLSQTTN